MRKEEDKQRKVGNLGLGGYVVIIVVTNTLSPPLFFFFIMLFIINILQFSKYIFYLFFF